MNRKFVLLCSVLLLGLSFVTPAKADVRDALRYVPSDAYLVAGGDGKEVAKSTLFRNLLDMLRADPSLRRELDSLQKQVGFDLQRDLRSLVVAATPEQLRSDEQIVMIAEAKIDRRKLLAQLSRAGALLPVDSLHGRYYRSKQSRRAVAFRDGLVIVGGDRVVPQALKKTGPGASLKPLLAKVRQRDLFAASVPTPKVRRELAKKSRDLGELEQGTLGADVDGGLDLDAELTFAKAATSKRIATQINQARERLKNNSAMRRMGLGAMAAGLEVKQQGKKLTGKLRLSDAQIGLIALVLGGMM